MCGIAGVLHKKKNSSDFPVGQALLTLSECLQHRGADSAGVAVFTEAQEPGKASLQMLFPHNSDIPQHELIRQAVGGGSRVVAERRSALELLVPEENGTHRSMLTGRLPVFLENKFPGATVSAYGRRLQIRKAVGKLGSLHSEASELTGTHGIAHLRLATESAIDPAHAQPFWGRPFADVAATHNGHITNYFKVRRKLEARGFSFASHNDSEVIGLLVGQKLNEGFTLFQSVSEVASQLDGSFAFIVAAPEGLGAARDPFATKPLLYCETPDLVALASEPRALHRLMGDTPIQEMSAGEVKTWAL